MGMKNGFSAINNYAGAANDQARVQLLIDLLPNPDASTTTGNGSRAGTGNTYLDEITPGAATQLLVELDALKAAVS